jgi:hypothetical protein
MRRQRRSGLDRGKARLVAAAWSALTARERLAALAVARNEGRRAARRALEELAAEIAGRDDPGFRLHAQARSIACEHFYVEHVIEPCCPERASWWWGSEIAERRADPRVCAFCDAYERKRRRMLGLPQPPAGIAALHRFLGKAQEEERERARAWMETLETSYSTAEYGEMRQSVARWEYRRCQLATDLAQMMFDAAIDAAVGAIRERCHSLVRKVSRMATLTTR